MSEHRRRFIDTRVLDDLGRVVIPKEARQLLGLSEGTRVKILVEDDKRIVFEATEDACPSCGR
ncbi:MAG: AbrB/MazE/SpoVT family DNA-binding domain-containing protein [Defluviitaleaceae bacterium]|nr:AbrB/MazE/SpoVT family DNA-binding domain-containing protein [Defluviitaleaceae bacterium]